MLSSQKFVVSIAVVSIFLSACASTTLTAVWKDDAYIGSLRKVLVLAVLDNPANRGIVESALVNELKKQGGDAIASNALVEFKDLNQANLNTAAEDNQVDSLMAVRVTGVDQESVYHAPVYSVPYTYYYTWGSYYPHMHDYIGMPAYTATYKYYNVETNVYDKSTEKLIWSAASQTVDPTDIQIEAEAFARKIVGSLESNGLVQRTASTD